MKHRIDFEYAINAYAPSILLGNYRREIERAIDNAKRSKWDQWWRRQFYRETAKFAKAYSSRRRRTSGARRW